MCHCFPILTLTKPLLCAYQPYRTHARRFIQLMIPLVNGPPVLLGYLDFSIIPCLLLGSPGGGQQYLFYLFFQIPRGGLLQFASPGVFSGSARWPPHLSCELFHTMDATGMWGPLCIHVALKVGVIM